VYLEITGVIPGKKSNNDWLGLYMKVGKDHGQIV